MTPNQQLRAEYRAYLETLLEIISNDLPDIAVDREDVGAHYIFSLTSKFLDDTNSMNEFKNAQDRYIQKFEEKTGKALASIKLGERELCKLDFVRAISVSLYRPDAEISDNAWTVLVENNIYMK